ncbi:MAG: DUF488 domain-containing protein [Sedimentisphaerales bacterium]|nr:DUF488 domain-containing protein [Sedimentisphaerales bacterium]
MKELFTIGHSNHPLDRFIELLSTHRLSTIIDVRSCPYSKYSSHFNKEVLAIALQNANIDYIFMGRELGAQRSEDDCYIEGQAKYDRIAHLSTFRHGLEIVLQEIERNRAALMCAESDPITCHRTILICRELKKTCPDLKITHILPDGTEEQQELSEKRLINLHKLQPELFGDLTSTSGLIEKAYDLQAEKIAYKKVPIEA